MSGEEYRRAMDTLARETTMPPESAARIERHLLEALESYGAVDVVPQRPVKAVVWRPWVAAAAAVVLMASIAVVWWMNRPLVTVGRHEASSRAAEESPPAPPAVIPPIERPSSGEVRIAHSPIPIRKSPKKANVITPSGFVDLPWTAGLPAFESGEIVRMDIPVASLPTYGIDISSGAGKGPIEADVLIGQDGFARAIRLVVSSSRSTQ